MTRKLLILSAIASLAIACPLQGAEKTANGIAPVQAGVRGTIRCHGVQEVPMTADAEQTLPMRIVATLKCGDEVAIFSGSESYTAKILTADGKSGYVARMYLAPSGGAPRTNTPKHAQAPSAPVDNGIARWESGAAGCGQYSSGGALVESLTANGITVQVSLHDTGWKLRANVIIANDTSEQVHFDPSGFTLDELMPRLKSLAYQDPRQLAKAVTHQLFSTAASASAPAGAVAQHSVSSSGTYAAAAYRTTAYDQAAPTYVGLERATEQLNTSVLNEGTVQPNDKITGAVWFARDKNSQQLNLRIFVGDQIFEFPFAFGQHE